MTKAQLLATASELGVEGVSSRNNKAEIIAAIEAVMQRRRCSMATFDQTVLLQSLKVDLGIVSKAYDERLSARLQSAEEELGAMGITLENSARDRDLVIMYAAWLHRDRIEGKAMPRMLKRALNNRLFGEKARTEVADA